MTLGLVLVLQQDHADFSWQWATHLWIEVTRTAGASSLNYASSHAEFDYSDC